MKSAVAQAIPSILTSPNADEARVFRFVSRALRSLVDRGSARALGLLRQHFLKPDAVFFGVLVYSE